MRGVFHHRLANDSSVCLLGEDIEDKKGDVFGVTKGLSTRFKGRVVNSALSESTIVGVCAGMALAGKHPVAFIQFADFMPLAFNQIANELATMYWRTAGSWETPVIIFAPCGGYKPGLGPFHSMTNEAIYTHIPGVDVYMPSNAGDAAGLLNAAFESKRPSIFLYPKKLLNNTGMADTTSPDIHRHLVPPATARILNVGSDITLLTWGNGIEICIDVASTLEQENISVEIMDLRTMHPYDLDAILKSVEKTEKMLIVHEDNQSCGVGAEISAAVNENATIPVTVRRATRADTYTPCNFANQLEVLPSYERVLENACDMLDIDVEWINKGGDDASLYEVEVLGASPSDESVTILDLHVSEGDQIKASAIVAETETSKSTSEILSPLSGTVEKMHYNEGDQATVGESLLSLRLPTGTSIPPGLKRQQKKPVLTPKDPGFCKVDVDTGALPFKVHRVGISVPVFKTGSKLVTNEDLVENFPGRTAEEIRELMGVDQRWWLDEGESIVNIAANTAHEMLEKEGLTLQDIDSIVCATCTPDEFVSPSIACLVLYQLYQIYGEHAVQAVDLNAACSGYLYALQHANNYLKTRPYGKVLVITAEALSKRLDKHDFNTAFLFADAASSTIVYGESYLSKAKAMINKVSLAATAEDGAILNIPTEKKSEEEGITLQNGITLKGQKLFTYAVKHMSMILKKCLERTQWSIDELDLVIPHQANQRISHAIEKRLGMKKGSMYSNIAKYGNTSSCTIPIGMAEMMHDTQKDNKIALAAFGSGFTYGAITLSVIH
jgi:2-oxoisovalerate dehydrogenase E1 component